MSTAKDDVQKILDQLPEDATLEEIQYHIYVCQKIARGLKDAAEGQTLSHEEVEQRMTKWLKN